MTSRISFFFTEALRSLFTNLATSVAAIIAMTVALVVFGMFFFVLLFVNDKARDIEKSAGVVKIYLEDSASEQDVNAIRETLESDPAVKTPTFVSKADALERANELFKDNKDIIENLPVNPFPASLEAEVVVTTDVAEVAAKYEGSPGVKDIEFGGERAQKVINVARWIQWGSFALAAVLLVASTILVSNTIRLSIFARRREIEVMKLVGASNGFVRVPFMIEGFIFGFFGAIGAMAMLGSLAWVMERFVRSELNAGGLPVEILGTVALAVLGVGLALGSVGSGLTIRRFLRV